MAQKKLTQANPGAFSLGLGHLRRQLRRLSLAVPAIALVTGLAVAPVVGATGTGALNLNPSSQQVAKGKDFAIHLRLAPWSTPVDTVIAKVTFDSSKMQYLSINYDNSPFTTQLPGHVGSDSVRIISTILGGFVSSNALIATLNFKALVGYGSTTVQVQGNTARNAQVMNPSFGDAKVYFNPKSVSVLTCPAGAMAARTACPAGQFDLTALTEGSSPSAALTTTSPAPASALSSASPTISQPTVGYTDAKLTVSTKAPSQVYLRYGLSANSLTTQTPMSSLATTHDISLSGGAIAPGSTYYYQVYSVDSSGQTSTTDVRSFSTKGVTLTIGFFDKNHRPLSNKSVTIHSTPETAQTNNNGYATFTNVAPGDHTVTYSDGSHTYSQPLTVANTIPAAGQAGTLTPQNFSVVYDLKQGPALTEPIIIVIVAAIVLGFLAFVINKRRQSGYNTAATQTAASGGKSAGSKQDDVFEKLERIKAPEAKPGTVYQPDQDAKSGEDEPRS